MEPVPPPGGDPRLQPLIDYLEQHRRQITTPALRAQLLAAGHPPELVDEAVRRVESGPDRKPAAWPMGLLAMLANIVALPALLIAGGSVAGWLYRAAGLDLWWLPFLLILLILIGEAVAGLRLRGGPRDRLGRALIWGLGFKLIALALAAMAAGVCIAVVLGSQSW